MWTFHILLLILYAFSSATRFELVLSYHRAVFARLQRRLGDFYEKGKYTETQPDTGYEQKLVDKQMFWTKNVGQRFVWTRMFLDKKTCGQTYASIKKMYNFCFCPDQLQVHMIIISLA